jgi:hypothetical protein
MRRPSAQAAKDALAREGTLAARIRAGGGPFDPTSLSRSYAVPVDRVREIIIRNGGSYAQ